MSGQPLVRIDLSSEEIIWMEGVAVEEIRNNGEVAFGGEKVGDELNVGVVRAEDIAEN